MGPEVGTLAGVLADHTSAADACSVGLWSGFGEGGAAMLYMAGGSLPRRLATRWVLVIDRPLPHDLVARGPCLVRAHGDRRDKHVCRRVAGDGREASGDQILESYEVAHSDLAM